MESVSSKEFGLLLGHFFGNSRAVLSAPAAAVVSGFGVRTALQALNLLENEGILRSRLRGRRKLFRAAAGSRSYWRCRAAYALQPRLLS